MTYGFGTGAPVFADNAPAQNIDTIRWVAAELAAARASKRRIW
jgi:hypothetical protein